MQVLIMLSIQTVDRSNLFKNSFQSKNKFQISNFQNFVLTLCGTKEKVKRKGEMVRIIV